LFLFSSSFASDVSELITDRPDQTESSSTVPPGYIQIELGFEHSEHERTDLETDVFPQTLLRAGVSDNLEFRFGFDGYFWENAVDLMQGAEDNEGAGDLGIGFKLKLRDEQGWLPETAFLTNVVLPMKQTPFSSERYDPEYRLSCSHTISNSLSFGYNLGQAWVTEEDASGDLDTRHQFVYTAALGIGLSNNLGGFVEFFGEIPTGSDGGPANSFDGGFTYLLADNVQLDISSGIGLSQDAEDWFLAAGLSIRFPQ
jgi:hypothetical protein